MNTQRHILAFKNYLNYRRYSPNTIKTYSEALNCFFHFYENKSVESLNIDDIIHFNSAYILKKNLSASYQNQVINAIKLFYSNRFNKIMEVDGIQRPRREKRLPNVLIKKK